MPMTRGMVVIVLGKLVGVDIANYSGASFYDVDASQHYAPYVKWAADSAVAAVTAMLHRFVEAMQ